MSENAQSSGDTERKPTKGKAKRHVIPNEQQCWPLLYKAGKGNWQIHSVHLTYDSMQEAREELHAQYDEWERDVITRSGSRRSPTELVGGEHVVRTQDTGMEDDQDVQ